MVLDQLEQMSVSTVRRILSQLPWDSWKLPRRRPRPNPVAGQRPVHRIPWGMGRAGHVEVDLVRHGGRSAQ